MTNGNTAPGAEHRGLMYWMDRTLKELEKVRTSPDAETVHDLRVAIRRCRSVAAVVEEVDPDKSWPAMRKLGRKLFRQLGELRDTQVLLEWLNKLSPEDDPVKLKLQRALEAHETEAREAAVRAAGKFDEKSWRKLGRVLRRRVRLVPLNGPAAQCLALERLDDAKHLHSLALRTEKPEPWHELRIGVKRFRYTVESLLPALYDSWGDDLKHVQDLLGDVHDLDVLAARIAELSEGESSEHSDAWRERITTQRQLRLEEYRQLTMGNRRLLQEWRDALPREHYLEVAALARLRSTSRAIDRNPRRTALVSRITMRLWEGFARIKASPVLEEPENRWILRAASHLHGIGSGLDAGSPAKAARKFLRGLPMPPGWSEDEWELLALVVRHHRGEEPKPKHKAFARLSEEDQKIVRTLAGFLRVGRALRKCGVVTAKGIVVEPSAEAFVVRVPALEDTPEAAARVAAGKHLLESTLDRPILVQSLPAVAKLLEMPPAPQVQTAIASD